MVKVKKKGSITINDIAEKLKIAPSTVSRALNNHPRISEDTKRKVLKQAENLGYRGNMPEIYSLPPQMKKIGVIIPHFDKNIYPSALSGINKVAMEHGYNVVVSISENNPNLEGNLIKSFSELKLDGLIISFTRESKDVSSVLELRDEGVKVVSFYRVADDFPLSKVVVDNFHGAFIGTKHLLSVGCKQVAYLSGSKNCPIYSERVKGYKNALEEAGIKFDKNLLMYSELTQDDLTYFLNHMFSLKNPPDGLMINDNLFSLQAYSYLMQLGINVPKDVAIASFGTEAFNSFISPSFTSVEFSSYNMGVKAATLLFNQISNKENINDSLIIEPSQLIIRNSTLS